jgi:hypothetical protein
MVRLILDGFYGDKSIILVRRGNCYAQKWCKNLLMKINNGLDMMPAPT